MARRGAEIAEDLLCKAPRELSKAILDITLRNLGVIALSAQTRGAPNLRAGSGAAKAAALGARGGPGAAKLVL